MNQPRKRIEGSSLTGWLRSVYPDGLLRMAADLISTNVSIVMAIVVWYFFYVLLLNRPQPPALKAELLRLVLRYSWLWSVLAWTTFQLHGFYSRTRSYAGRHKMSVVLRAVTIYAVAFVLLDVVILRDNVVSRGVALLSWLFLLATVGGSRWGKHLLESHYHVEPKNGSSKAAPQHILVVGGAGYLGSLLVPMLLERGYRVRVFDSLLFGKESLRAIQGDPRCEVLCGDVRDIHAVVQAVRHCDAVVDLAAIVGDPACEENRQLAVEVNRAATRMLIDVCRGYGIQRFLFASTCSVYGASDFLMDEHSEVAPLSLYAQTKVDSENLLLEAKSRSFHPTILRLATLFGASPRPRFDLVVNLLTARAVRFKKIVIYNGTQWRPFMHVHDAARAFLTSLAANLEVVSGEIFNAGSYELNHQLSELSEMIVRILPDVAVERVENKDRRNYRVSFDKIHTRLGFTCQRALEDGIVEMANMLRTPTIDNFASEIYDNRAMVKVYAQTPEAERSSIRLLEALTRTT
jgi:nucleoside-diphosphate-sugar epimerase